MISDYINVRHKIIYRKLLLALGCVLAAFGTAASQPACYPHDTFYWMTRINKATILMNTSVGLLDRDSVETAARHKGYLDWTKSSHEYLDAAEERLERDFHELVSRSPVSEAEADRCDATDQCPDIPYLRSEV